MSESNASKAKEYKAVIGNIPITAKEEFAAVKVVIDKSDGDENTSALLTKVVEAISTAVPKELLNDAWRDTPGAAGQQKVLTHAKDNKIELTFCTTGSGQGSSQPRVFKLVLQKIHALSRLHPPVHAPNGNLAAFTSRKFEELMSTAFAAGTLQFNGTEEQHSTWIAEQSKSLGKSVGYKVARHMARPRDWSTQIENNDSPPPPIER